MKLVGYLAMAMMLEVRRFSIRRVQIGPVSEVLWFHRRPVAQSARNHRDDRTHELMHVGDTTAAIPKLSTFQPLLGFSVMTPVVFFTVLSGYQPPLPKLHHISHAARLRAGKETAAAPAALPGCAARRGRTPPNGRGSRGDLRCLGRSPRR